MPKSIRKKLRVVLSIACFLHVSTYCFAQQITFQQQNSTIGQVFKAIKKQTGYNVLWFSDELDIHQKINAQFQHAPLEQVLKSTLRGLPITYTIEDKTIVLKKQKPTSQKKETSSSLSMDIQGRVTDKNNRPLAGASILIKGDRKVGTSDHNGNFLLTGIPEGSVLQIAYIGYAGQELIAKPDVGTVMLEMNTSNLDEVQIQAYGVTSRRLSTGNIGTVKAAEIAKQPVSNLLLTLQGKVPGLSIVQNTGMPGATPQVRIRGTNSIGAGLSPLYIVDGIPVPENQSAINGNLLGPGGISALENLNPNDIESIDVLKDADATAIYGSRGANGVILITTKKGQGGQMKVNLNGYTGIGKVQHFVDFMDVHQYNAMRREAFANTNVAPTPTSAPDLFSYDTLNVHNWQKEFIGGTAVTHDANVSVSGGTGGTTIYVNAGYHKQGTVFEGDPGSSRNAIRFNANHVSPNGKFTMGLISGYSTNTLEYQGTDLTQYINMPPSYPLYTEEGLPNFAGARGYPLAALLQSYRSESKNYNGHVSLSYSPIQDLSLKLDAGYNSNINDQRMKNPLTSLDPRYYSSGTLSIGSYKTNTWIAEPQINYRKALGMHRLNLLIGASFQKTTSDFFNGNGSNFVNDALLDNLSAAQTITVSTGDNIYAYTSVFGRLSYNYEDKYLANVSFRRDGSSRFGPNKRFGNFGALGLAWVFSEEHAVAEALPFLSYGKLRASYGVNGNDQVGDYQYVSTYSVVSNGYQGPTLSPTNLANPNFRWEQNRKLEAGLDLGFLEDRILLGASFFRNRTDNQLVNYTLSPQTGYGSYLANFPALLQNQGWEFTLNTTNISKANFSWKTAANIGFSQNKLVDFPGIEQTSYYSQYIVGKSITLLKGYVFDGLSNAGIPQYKDLNGDGVIDATNDRIVLGERNPFTGGLSNEFHYKQFELSFFIDYMRFSNFDPAVSASVSGSLGTNRTVNYLDRWQQPGDEAFTNIPKFTTTSGTYNARNFLQSDVNWKQANIFRLRNISFSYSLPNHYADKLRMRDAKVFFQAQNVWTSGNKSILLDPETGATTLPPLRTLTLGLNLTF